MLFSGKKSCGIATDRLKQLVLPDRMGCSPEILHMLQQDMAAAMTRYMDVEQESIVFSLQRDPACFTASVPLSAISGKRI